MSYYPQLPTTGKKRQQAFDECHVFKHWWQPTTVDEERDHYIQHMRCMRCDGERRWKVNKTTGDPEGNNYTMQDGYYNTCDGDSSAQQARKALRLTEIERNKSRRIRKVG